MTSLIFHPLNTLKNPNLLKTDALINGEWLRTNNRFAVNDPATGAHLADVSNLTVSDVQKAIDAAHQAWLLWRNQTAKQRHAILIKWQQLIIENQDDLAKIMTSEQGKPLNEAKNEVIYGANFIEWFAEQAKRINGETLPQFDNNRRLMTIKQAIGVCAAITPWNFPLAMITRKVAPALAAGCSVIIKPAELTPLTALALAHLAQEAGIPKGVLNVITADFEQSVAIGKELCANDVIRHISFTGSTEVGRLLMAQSAPTIKKISLELGGNAPFIVFDDADLDNAASGAMASKFRNAGQVCVASNRFYVQDSIYDAFIEKFAAKMKKLKIGNGFEEDVTQGPLIEEALLLKMERHIYDALRKGGKIIIGGKRVEGLTSRQFIEPTLLADANTQMICAKEETFGPFAPIFRFHTEEEVIKAANDTEFGLASYVYTRDIGRAFRVSEALEYGMVGVNTGSFGNEHTPFGGVKQSGLGREGSEHGIDEYLEIKFICFGDIQSH